MAMTVDELYRQNSIDNTATKICEKLNTVRNNSKSSAKRCIWEMMQNAKDVANPAYNGVSIEFEIVNPNTFIFRHNGKHFTLKNVTSLIQQVSSKSSTNEDEKVTGMFGTGFISTHLIAEKIDVQGILIDSNDKYRRFNLLLDRSGSTKEELSPIIERTMNYFSQLDSDINGDIFPFEYNFANHTENDFDTVFTYHIEKDSQLRWAKVGLEDLVNTLPVTLINLPDVKSVRVINRLEDTDISYSCIREKKDEHVTLSTIKSGNQIKKYLTFQTPDVALSLEVKEENDTLYAVKRDENLPVLLRDFPLIGSNQFHFPYFLNGFRFIPTEPRDGIQLHGDNDHKPSVNNRTIFEKAVDTALSFNQWLIHHNVHNRYLLASSRIPKSNWDEELSKPWIEKLQKEWRTHLLHQDLLETNEGIYSLSTLIYPDCKKKESREKFYDLLTPWFTTDKHLPKKDFLHEWSDILVEYPAWGASLKYSLEDFLKDLEKKGCIQDLSLIFGGDIQKTFDWLNQVIKFVIEELGVGVFDRYRILPNQKGTFVFAQPLARDNAQPIPTQVKDVYKIAFNKDIDDSLLHSLINPSLLAHIREYTLYSLVNDLNVFLKNPNNNWANRRDTSYKLFSLYSSDANKAHREAMNTLCRKFSTNVSTLNYVSNLPDELWTEADKLILTNIPGFVKVKNISTLSSLGKDFLNVEPLSEEEVIEWINLYLTQCNKIHCTTHLTSEQTIIFPNQEGNLKAIKQLSYDNNIPEELKDLADYAHTAVNWRASLLDKRIKGYTTQSPKTVSDIYRSIIEIFDKTPNKLSIAKHALALNHNNNADVSYIYRILSELYSDMPEQKELISADGFDWEKFIHCAIIAITGKVAEKININTLSKDLSNNLKTEYTPEQTINWIDKFLNFIFYYRGGIYKPTVMELKDHGIWVNQNGDFCMFSSLYRDGGIDEQLKDLSKNNPILHHDYREQLLNNTSEMVYAIDKSKEITQDHILGVIDKALQSYSVDKQNPDFRSLIFKLMDLDKAFHISDKMEFYKANKEKLIVGSLGEGETMNMVASIIQEGDEKIAAIQQLLKTTSLEEIQKIKETLNHASTHSSPDKIEIVKVTASDGNEITVAIDQAQYSGLSLEEIITYVSDTKYEVVKRFRELNEKYNLGLIFNEEQIKADSFSQLHGIYYKNGKEIPLVVHSYKGPQYRFFDLNYYDWEVLSQEGSMLWVLTVSGLQCIPFYALPIRSITIPIDGNLSDATQATLLTIGNLARNIAGEGKIRFEFGNNMPRNFKNPCKFNYMPEPMIDCVTNLQRICDESIPAIAGMYNLGKQLPLSIQENDYSTMLKIIEKEGSIKNLYDLPDNSIVPPVVNTMVDLFS